MQLTLIATRYSCRRFEYFGYTGSLNRTVNPGLTIVAG